MFGLKIMLSDWRIRRAHNKEKRQLINAINDQQRAIKSELCIGEGENEIESYGGQNPDDL